MSNRILWGMLVGIGAGLASLAVTFLLVLLSPRRKCPDCGTPMSKLRNHWDGSDVVRRCVKCGCGMDVKGRKVYEVEEEEATFEPVESSTAVADRSRGRSRNYDDEPRPRRRRRPAPKSSTGLIVAGICGGVVLLGLLILCIVMIAMQSGEAPPNVVRVDNPPAPRVEPQVPPPEDLGPQQAQTQILGTGPSTFIDKAPSGGHLIGFDVGLGPFMDIKLLKTIRPRYRTQKGEVVGRTFGPDFGDKIEVKAKPGYAVGAINVKAGLLVNGFSVTFMRVKGDKLDPNDRYESPWIGDKTGGGGPTTLGGDGTPIVGIIGRRTAHECSGLGLLKKL